MTQAQPPAIERIPDEVLHEIFVLIASALTEYDEHNFPVSGPHPLLPVVQVNRRFSAVATPLLVRRWHLRLTDESGVKFVLHLLKQPQLRSQIRSLSVDERTLRTLPRSPRAHLGHDHAPRAPGHRWPQSFCSTAELEQLAQSAEEICPTLACWSIGEEECSWAGQIRQRYPRAIAALALAWATGLQELNLLVDAWTQEDPGLWILRLVKMAVDVLSPLAAEDRGLPPPDVFTKLRRVSLGHRAYLDDSNGLMNGTTAASFFRLPSLRVFQALAVAASGLTLDQADPSGSRTAMQPLADQLFPNGTSGVEELHLYQCFVTDNGLGVLTRSCRSLRVMILSWGWNDNLELSNESIAAAIRLHSVSLEKIVIEGSYGTDHFDGSDPGSLGDCLVFCDKLMSLVIHLVMLYGRQYHDDNSSCRPLSELLPAGLTDLGLSTLPFAADGQSTKDNILELLSQCGPKKRFSRLKKIDLIGCGIVIIKDQEIIALAKEVGVELAQQDGPGGTV